METKYFRIRSLLIVILLLSLPLKELFAQCYIVPTKNYREGFYSMFGTVYPERVGNFATEAECNALLDQMKANDPVAKGEFYCDCDQPVETNSYDYPQQTTEPPVVKPKTQSELHVLQALAEEKKKLMEGKQFNDKREEVTGKLKGNKSFNQLKTSSNLSLKGQQNINNNQTDEGRKESESAFTDGKIATDTGELHLNPIPVPPPTPIDPQKNLFNYIDQETKTVQSKIIKVQKEKTELLEKKMIIQEKINEQKLNISNLKLEKMEAKEETKVEEIDSLLLAALQMLEESEQLNEKAAEELKEKDKLVQENEALLNRFQETNIRSKEHPEESEQLLKELRGDKK